MTGLQLNVKRAKLLPRTFSPHSKPWAALPKEIPLEMSCYALTIAAFSATASRLGILAKEPYKKVIKWFIRRLPKFRKIT